jgi:plasmid stabilization system protein ParE
VTLPVVWLQEAIDEYYESLRWYATISPSLSQRFAGAVEDTVQTITAYPFRFPIVSNDRRRAGVRRFPYSLFYLVENHRIVVIACFHGKRDLHRWQHRQQ